MFNMLVIVFDGWVRALSLFHACATCTMLQFSARVCSGAVRWAMFAFSCKNCHNFTSLMCKVVVLLFIVATCVPSFCLALQTIRKVTIMTDALVNTSIKTSSSTGRRQSELLRWLWCAMSSSDCVRSITLYAGTTHYAWRNAWECAPLLYGNPSSLLQVWHLCHTCACCSYIHSAVCVVDDDDGWRFRSRSNKWVTKTWIPVADSTLGNILPSLTNPWPLYRFVATVDAASNCTEPCASCQSTNAHINTFLFFTPEVRKNILRHPLLLQHCLSAVILQPAFGFWSESFLSLQFGFIVIMLSECLLFPVVLCTTPCFFSSFFKFPSASILCNDQ